MAPIAWFWLGLIMLMISVRQWHKFDRNRRLRARRDRHLRARILAACATPQPEEPPEVRHVQTQCWLAGRAYITEIGCDLRVPVPAPPSYPPPSYLCPMGLDTRLHDCPMACGHARDPTKFIALVLRGQAQPGDICVT